MQGSVHPRHVVFAGLITRHARSGLSSSVALLALTRGLEEIDVSLDDTRRTYPPACTPSRLHQQILAPRL